MKNIVFILSLPRSGSTLLQRMLMKHPKIRTRSEPWLMLPLAYLTKAEEQFFAPYDYSHAQRAISEMVQDLPEGWEGYCFEVGRFAKAIYEKMCPESDVYFVDKTPRYYLIIPFLLKVFPQAKFIFLFRNPLAVLASIIRTWGQGGLGHLYLNENDLFRGPCCLVEGLEIIGEKALRVQYEDLVRHPKIVMERISSYLDIESVGVEFLEIGKDCLSGTMGDKVGIKAFEEISDAPVESWRETMNTKFRVYYGVKYLEKVGEEVICGMGYSYRDLLSELHSEVNLEGIGTMDFLDWMRMTTYKILTGGGTRKVLRKILIPGLLTWKLRSEK